MPDTQQENAKNLKNLGLKATGPRLKILEIFQERAKAGEDRHLSAEEVYKEPRFTASWPSLLLPGF